MKLAIELSNIGKKDVLNGSTAILATAIICAGMFLSQMKAGNSTVTIPCNTNMPLSEDCLLRYAEELKLNTAEFKSCLSDTVQSDALKAELDQNKASKIFGSPSIVMAVKKDGVVNGFLLGNLLGLENISGLLDKALTSDIESAQRYWVQTRLGYLNQLREEVKKYFSDPQGGSLKGSGLEDRVNNYMADMRSAAEMESELRQFLITTDRSMGSGDLMLIEFTDYECPFCRDFEKTVMSALRQQYSDKITFVFRHLPESGLHPNALKAATAAECAENQGKFFEYSAKLFGL